MRSCPTIGADPAGDDGAGVIEIVEQRFVQEFIPHPAVEGLADSVLHRLARSDEAMKCQAKPASWVQASIAFEENSVPWSETIRLGLPRRRITSASSRATRRPEIEVSGISARHSFVASSIALRMRKRRPEANWSETKSIDHRAFGLVSTRIGARVPVARLRPLAQQSLLPEEAQRPLPVHYVPPGGTTARAAGGSRTGTAPRRVRATGHEARYPKVCAIDS